MSKAGVVNMLDVSTGNVSLETSEKLKTEVPEGFSIYPTSHGWFVSGAKSEHIGGWPEDFQKLVAYAEENDCGWINLDSDANEIDELESFDW